VNYLKGRAIRLFKRTHPGAILASGVRLGESRRRMGTAKPESRLEGMRCVAPILGWTTARVWDYIHANGIEISPAWWNLHISGDCLCGAFARPEEIYLIETFYPEVAARLRGLERERVGKPRCRWGNGEGFGKQTRIEGLLCQGCQVRT
jgi:3'-phosphoadenosine 5'-phosphosulfate sulfotransferase (PAPS reductase)/FAD synthetase